MGFFIIDLENLKVRLADCLLIILISILLSRNQNEMTRFFLVGGYDFGERALVTNEPRSATVMTIVPTDLLVVDREVFSRFVDTIHIN